MTKDPFDLYKLPVGLAETVAIPLKGTPAVFHVMLPSSTNEDFNMALIGRLNAQVDDNGEIKVDAIRFQTERRNLFFEDCVKKADGLPDGLSADDFFTKYPLAKRAIHERAVELAAQADDEVQEALGKFESLPNGKSSGRDGTISTSNSSKKESKSKQNDPTLAA